MAIVQRLAHLSKLAFFLSLGIVATVIDACSDGGQDPEPSAGGVPNRGGSSASGGSTNTATGGDAGRGGTTAPSSQSGGKASTGGSSAIRDAGTDLWDVICE